MMPHFRRSAHAAASSLFGVTGRPKMKLTKNAGRIDHVLITVSPGKARAGPRPRGILGEIEPK
jgi:hypothetical protein